MEREEPFVLKFVKQNLLFVGLFSLAIVLIIVGLFQYFSPQKSGVEFVPADAKATVSASKIMVDVEGAVEKPGVYELESNARLQDAIASAGGLSAEADREYISKGVNLAQTVTDGLKIYIPKVGEQVAGIVSTANSGSSTSISGSVNINSASQSQLEDLPKIGPVTAQKIIDGRPYSSIEELLSKKVVGQATFEAIKDKITIL